MDTKIKNRIIPQGRRGRGTPLRLSASAVNWVRFRVLNKCNHFWIFIFIIKQPNRHEYKKVPPGLIQLLLASGISAQELFPPPNSLKIVQYCDEIHLEWKTPQQPSFEILGYNVYLDDSRRQVRKVFKWNDVNILLFRLHPLWPLRLYWDSIVPMFYWELRIS